jgi:hypothetical protein
MSTAFHPQTDGQTEVMNKTLEQMIRAYINTRQDNWDELLPYCELAYNNSKSESTGFTPFYLNFGQEVNLPSSLVAGSLSHPNAAVEDLLSSLSDSLSVASANLKSAQEHQRKYANLKRRDEEYKVGDRVMLSTADINFAVGTKKLLAKYIGPFTIIERVSSAAYKLDLPKNLRIHPVINISRLDRFVANDSVKFPGRMQVDRPVPSLLDDGREAWYVERIIDKRLRKNKIEYLVKWEGYPEWENSWEPVSNLKRCKEAISFFEQSRS